MIRRRGLSSPRRSGRAGPRGPALRRPRELSALDPVTGDELKAGWAHAWRFRSRADIARLDPGWQSALFAHEQLTGDELEAELADLVDKQRSQIESTLMSEVHEMRRATLTLRDTGRASEPRGVEGESPTLADRCRQVAANPPSAQRDNPPRRSTSRSLAPTGVGRRSTSGATSAEYRATRALCPGTSDALYNPWARIDGGPRDGKHAGTTRQGTDRSRQTMESNDNECTRATTAAAIGVPAALVATMVVGPATRAAGCRR